MSDKLKLIEHELLFYCCETTWDRNIEHCYLRSALMRYYVNFNFFNRTNHLSIYVITNILLQRLKLFVVPPI